MTRVAISDALDRARKLMADGKSRSTLEIQQELGLSRTTAMRVCRYLLEDGHTVVGRTQDRQPARILRKAPEGSSTSSANGSNPFDWRNYDRQFRYDTNPSTFA